MDSTDNSQPAIYKCTKCGEEKPLTLDYFYHSTKTARGFQSWCKDCQKRRNQSDEGKMYSRAYFQRPEVKERQRELDRLRQQSNPRIRTKPRNPRISDEERREKRRVYLRNWRKSRPQNTVSRKSDKPSPLKRYATTQEQAAAYYQAHREELLQRAREYRQRNLEKMREKERQRYQTEREERIEKAKERFRNNPDLQRAAKQRRRARKQSLPNAWTAQHWLMCLDYWHNTCAVCGGQLRGLFDIEPHADHWIPLSYKGTDNPGTVPGNMICLCSSCNLSKQDTMPDEWIVRHYGKRKAGEILNRIQTYFEYMKGLEGES